MTNYDAAREYLAKVLPFDEEGEAYVSLHWMHPFVQDRALRSVEEIINTIEWATQGKSGNFFVSMASQVVAKEVTSQAGRPYIRAVRQQSNVKALKAIWLDVDNKQYESASACYEAIEKFILDTKLPEPSMVVDSGGGYHVYWTFVEHLTPVVWKPLAHSLAEAARQHNLKADTQCTVDSVRILRVPDTYNLKYDPPRLATIKSMGNDYFVARLVMALAPYQRLPGKSSEEIVIDLPPKVPLEENELGAGIEKALFPPVDARDVVAECPFIMQTLKTAGKGYAQPIWNLTILMATFMLEGRLIAHLFSRGHDKYLKEDTDAMFDRKEKEKNEHNIKWPLCQTIAGHPEAACCKVCPHLRENKTPFHFRKLHKVNGHALNITATTLSNQYLPVGYTHLPDNIIAKIEQDTDGNITHRPLSSWPIYDPSLQMDEKNVLHFTADNAKVISLPMKVITARDVRATLQDQGCELHENQVKPIGAFLVSWITELKRHKSKMSDTKPLGWNEGEGGLTGFSYNGQVWSKRGSTKAPPLDPNTLKLYTPVGKPELWTEAAKLVTDQMRPELNIILASAFAAPLVKLTGHKAYLLSAYSLDSGIGKTTAMKVAQSVWGHPTAALQSITDTQNSVNNKMGRTNSLPLYWDELRVSQQSKSTMEFLLQLTSGREKDRLDSHSNAKQVRTWHTIMVCASNESILNYVTSQSNTTAAGIYRIVEFAVAPGQIGQVSVTQASHIINKLEYNFGHAGLTYAQYLGANIEAIDKDLLELQEELTTELSVHSGERFWLINFACLILGARYANALHLTEIDEPAMREFLTKNFHQMRQGRSEQIIDLKQNNQDLARLINQYINEVSSRNILKTDIIYMQPGIPAIGAVKTLASPTDAAHIQIGMQDNRLTLDVDQLERWLLRSKFAGQTHTFIKEMGKHPGVKRRMGKIGVGTDKVGGQTALFDIDITQVPELNIMG